VSPIPEASPSSDKSDSVSVMCQQLAQGLSLLSHRDDDAAAPPADSGNDSEYNIGNETITQSTRGSFENKTVYICAFVLAWI
jgi:hypothetical protein